VVLTVAAFRRGFRTVSAGHVMAILFAAHPKALRIS